MNKQFISQKEVIEMTGVSRPSLYRLRKKGEFPQSVQLSERRIGFVKTEVEFWMDKKINQRANQI